MGNIVQALKGIDLLAWEHGANYSNLRRKALNHAYDNTNWAPGSVSFQHFCNTHSWTKVIDAKGVADLMKRWDRACELSECHVTARAIDYQVTSQTDPNKVYIVSLEKGCTCPDASSRAPMGWCKRRLAVSGM